MDIQKILSNCSSQQGTTSTFLKLLQPWPMSAGSAPADRCNLTEFFDFTFESISVSCNFDSNTSEIQKILSNCSSQQGAFLKLRQVQPMSGLHYLTRQNSIFPLARIP